MKKICPNCNKKKPFNAFYKDLKSKDGYNCWCKKCKSAKQSVWSRKHPNEKVNKRLKIRRLELKARVMKEYGNRCTCCGEGELLFLSIDHINGNGAEDRRKKTQGGKGGTRMYEWLVKNNFPKDNYQILCFNCNLAKGFYGKCPHKK